jgi:hypothetical protein
VTTSWQESRLRLKTATPAEMASAGPMPFAALLSDSARSRSRRARRGDGIRTRDLGAGSVPAAVRHSCASQIKDTGFHQTL